MAKLRRWGGGGGSGDSGPVNVALAVGLSAGIFVLLVLAAYLVKRKLFDPTLSLDENKARFDELCEKLSGHNEYEALGCCEQMLKFPYYLFRTVLVTPIILFMTFGYGPFLLFHFFCCCCCWEHRLRDANARSATSSTRPRIPSTHVVDHYDDERGVEEALPPPSLKWQMHEYAKEHVCARCDGDDGALAVRRQRDGAVRVRCRACGAYIPTHAVTRWFAEEWRAAESEEDTYASGDYSGEKEGEVAYATKNSSERRART
jgi:hypothetical protein